MIIKQNLIYVMPNYEIISVEIEIIQKQLELVYEEYSKSININNMNRSILIDNLMHNFQCYTIQYVFGIILKLMIKMNDMIDAISICKLFGNSNNNKSVLNMVDVSPTINNFLTEIRYIATSTEGYTLKSGFRFLNDLMVIKTSNKEKLYKSLIHEYFIGQHLNMLRKSIPNFMYTYGIFDCNLLNISEMHKENVQICTDDKNKVTYVIFEYIKGYTFYKHLEINLNITLQTILSTISQVLCSLQIAYDKFGYCHNDLHLDNIMLRTMSDKKYIKYDIASRNQVMYVLADSVATIIDYGYNSIEYNRNKYKVMYFINENNKVFSWGYKDYKNPGIDLAKFFIHLVDTILKMSTNNVYPFASELIENIDNTFSIDFGISGLFNMENHSSYIPIVYDSKLLNINAYDFLEKLLKRFTKESYDEIIYLTNPPKGYKILNDMNKCESNIIETIKLFTSPIDKDTKCGTNDWKSLQSWKYPNGSSGKWVECGKYTDNSGFVTILYPEGISMYKGGSKLIESNLEFSETGELQIIPESTLISFLGDYNEALKESFNSKCGKNCIGAYKLKYEMQFLDIFNEFNIKKLLIDNSIFTEQDKIEICEVFGINYREISKSKKVNINLISKMILKSHKSNTIRQISNNDKFLINLFKYISKLSIYGIIHMYNFENNIQGYQIIVLNDLDRPLIYRDMSNELDWQYFDNNRLFGEIGNFIKDFKNYTFQSNKTNKQGDPFQTSVWTTLYIQKQFIYNTFLVQNISQNYFNCAIAAGFLSEIGIGGDLNYKVKLTKDDIIKRAKLYLDDGKASYKYKINDDIHELDIKRLLRDMNVINDNDYKLVVFLILSLDLTKTLLNSIINKETWISNTTDYIYNILDIIKSLNIKFNVNNEIELIITYVKLAILIAVCSMYGDNVYINNEKFEILESKLETYPNLLSKELNSYISTLPFITNQPRKYKGETIDISINKKAGLVILFIESYIKKYA